MMSINFTNRVFLKGLYVPKRSIMWVRKNQAIEWKFANPLTETEAQRKGTIR